MGDGAALSMETSDITLLDSNLEKLVFAIGMGRRVTNKVVQNIIFSFCTKALVLGFALTKGAHLWAAIGADVGAMLVVTLNAMTLLPSKNDTNPCNATFGHAESNECKVGFDGTCSNCLQPKNRVFKLVEVPEGFCADCASSIEQEEPQWR